MPDIKSQMRRFMDEVINKHNIGAIDQLLSADFVEHEELPGIPTTRDGVKQFFSMMLEAFPDMGAEMTHVLADGDTATVRSVLSGTHKGEFMGIPATGKRFEVPMIDIVRFDGETAVEHWGSMDMMMMMTQLGAMQNAPA